MLPLLFVTIACGAISGFHGLVASGTTSKQLDKETDARFVGYFGAVGEGSLSLATIIAATAGFATLADWEAVYSSFGQGGVSAFVEGGANIISQGLGLDIGVSETLLTVMAVLFAGTTMDTGLRLQRYIFQEWETCITLTGCKSLSGNDASCRKLLIVSLRCWRRRRFRRLSYLASVRYHKPVISRVDLVGYYGHVGALRPTNVLHLNTVNFPVDNDSLRSYCSA